jgi:hypothetical protein
MNAQEPNPNGVVPAATAPLPSFADRKFRQKLRDELRAEEWDMHRELIGAGRAILEYLQNNPHKYTVADLARVMELSSKLARLATQPDCDLDLGDDGTAVMIDFHAALRKVYTRRESEGRPLPKGVIIDAEMAGGETASPSAPPGGTP